MSHVALGIGYFNPFSNELSEACVKFNQINEIWKKVAVVVATIFAALLTLPLLGIGSIAVFRFLVERMSERLESETEAPLFLQSVVAAAPWTGEWGEGQEPYPLPEQWQKHRAKQEIIVLYKGVEVHIPKGGTYFTYQGKVAVGWHGSINPPHAM